MSRSVEYADEAGGEEAFDYVVRTEIDDEDEDESPSPRTALLSARGNSRETLHLAERPRNSSRMDRSRRRSSTHRELLKFIVDEEIEAVKQTRRALNAALERLAGETRRAQEAEHRALEIAQRFKTVNEARIAAQQESARLSEQLVLYKVQFENAERELSRGQDLLKDLESQRDEAEAAAARARDTARRLREQQLIRQAREDGRREGYNEGLRRAYREARMNGFRGDRMDDGATDRRDEAQGQDGLQEARGRRTTLDEFSPDMPGDTRLPPSINVTLDEPASSSSRPPPGSYPGGAEGSRFRENIASPGASTLASLPVVSSARPLGPPSWTNPPPAEGPRFTHPQVVRTASPAPQHPNYDVPPDGWIPAADADSYIRLPPPHEMSQQPPVSPRTPLSPLPDIIPMDGGDPSLLQPQVSSRDYAYGGRQRSSPGSLAESLPSTTMSSYDLLNSPRTAARIAGRERGPVLSAIEEVPTSMEFSPGTESRARSSIMPEPFAPIRSPRPEGSYTGSDVGRRPASRGDRRENESSAGSSRRKSSRTPRNEPGESVRTSVASVQEWLGKNSADDAMQYQSPPLKSPYSAYVTDATPMNRSASPFDRPYSSASGDASRHRRSRSMNSPPENGSGHRSSEGHRRVISSGSVAITVQSPSAPGSTASPGGGMDSGRLTPSSTMRTVPPSQPYVPTAPSSPALRNLPSMGTLVDYPAGFIPAGAPLYNMSTTPAPPSPKFTQEKIYSRIVPDQADGGSADWGRPVRTASRNSSRTVNDALRPKTPGARPSSAMDGAPSSISRASSQHSYIAAPSRSHTPSDPRYIPPPLQAGMGYPESAQRRSMAPPSPRTLAAGVALPGSASALGDSPRSATSRLSGHHRSLSLHAGSTPAANARPLSGTSRPQLRRVPSTGSISSNHSAYKRFDPKEYVDPAWAASSENLLDVQSPGTMANTRQNAFGRERSRSPGGGHSPALSYQSLGNRG